MLKIPATIACILLIFYLFRVDRERPAGVSHAIWLPFFWLIFAASREFSFWLNYFFHVGAYYGTIEEGNLLERVFHLILMTLGIIVLVKRRITLHEIFTRNAWIWLFFVYAAISLSWSDHPYVAFKRWFKTMGTITMLLVILTEERPYEAIGLILRRIAFVLLPLSILFVRYYPDLGRSYHSHLGGVMFTGVTGQKNGLGMLCLVSGTYIAWNFLLGQWKGKEWDKRLHKSIFIILLPMIAWLLYKANSATSLACLIISVGILAVARQPQVHQKPNSIMILSIVGITVYGLLETVFDLNNAVISMLGRRPDLTTRVPMWQELLTMARDPVTGFGFETFWLGERRDLMIDHWGIDRQAHNGYLDMYLNLGYIGLFFVLAWILTGLRNVYNHLLINYPHAVLRFCFIVVFVFYSWTESVFHKTSFMWALFLLGIMDSPSQRITANSKIIN